MIRIISTKRLYHSRAIRSYYDILSVSKNATAEEIKAAYYKKAKDCHPDISQGSAIEFQKLKEAYETLNDSARRRAYDATIVPLRESAFEQTYQQPRSRPDASTEKFLYRRDYIQHVYKTLNKENNEEPKFRPFEDHNYPGSDYNRFMYARRWDPDNRAWVYNKRPTAGAYTREMTRKGRNLNYIVTVIMFAIGISTFYYRFLGGQESMARMAEERAIRVSLDKHAGIFVIPDAQKR